MPESSDAFCRVLRWLIKEQMNQHKKASMCQIVAIWVKTIKKIIANQNKLSLKMIYLQQCQQKSWVHNDAQKRKALKTVFCSKYHFRIPIFIS